MGTNRKKNVRFGMKKPGVKFVSDVLNLYHELLEKDKVFIRPKALNLFLVFYLKLYLNFLE